MKDPEYAARYREYQRIWHEGKRRQQGIPVRTAMYEKRQIRDETPLVDPAKFIAWFNSLNGTAPDSVALGEALTRRIFAIRSGEQKQIHLSQIYEVALIVGAPEIPYILYPDH